MISNLCSIIQIKWSTAVYRIVLELASGGDFAELSE